MNKTEHRGLKWRVPPDMTRFRQVLNSPAPIFPIALTLIYYDQRIRNEGYYIECKKDAQELSRVAGPLAGISEDATSRHLDSAGAEVQPG